MPAVSRAVIQRCTPFFFAALAFALGAAALANTWFALRDPVELEVREGTVWLYVLAQDAGQSLYDPSNVAFVNMNHGPLDPVFKGWIHRAAPFLPAQVVTRAFVAILPLALAALFGLRLRSRSVGCAWAAGVYVFLLGLGPAQFLIGRSDPTVLTLFCVLIALADAVRSRGTNPPLRTPLWGFAIGIVGAAVVFTNWRYLPATAVAVVGFGADRFVIDREAHRARRASEYLLGIILGAVVVAATILGALFHGDAELFYRHFFGVFTRASGWGTQGRMPFELFPYELFDGRNLIHVALALGWLVAVWSGWRKQASRMAVMIWILLFAALWVAITWGFFYNHGAGGLHYYAPFYVLLTYYVATRADWTTVRPNIVAAIGAALVAGLPLATVLTQAKQLAHTARDARQFAARIDRLTTDGGAYSEDVHLFRRRYHGETIDVGDMASELAKTGYLGPVFTRTVQQTATRLALTPPPYVVVAALDVVTPDLRQLLATRYTLVMQSAPLIIAEGIPVRVYRSKDVHLEPRSP